MAAGLQRVAEDEAGPGHPAPNVAGPPAPSFLGCRSSCPPPMIAATSALSARRCRVMHLPNLKPLSAVLQAVLHRAQHWPFAVRPIHPPPHPPRTPAANTRRLPHTHTHAHSDSDCMTDTCTHTPSRQSLYLCITCKRLDPQVERSRNTQLGDRARVRNPPTTVHPLRSNAKPQRLE